MNIVTLTHRVFIACQSYTSIWDTYSSKIRVSFEKQYSCSQLWPACELIWQFRIEYSFITNHKHQQIFSSSKNEMIWRSRRRFLRSSGGFNHFIHPVSLWHSFSSSQIESALEHYDIFRTAYSFKTLYQCELENWKLKFKLMYLI